MSITARIPGVDPKFASDDDIFNWHVTIDGPEGTPFLGGKFILHLDFSENYPFKWPKVKFLTKIYHPNVSEQGEICMRAIEENWAPTRNATFIVETVLTLIKCPQLDDPLDENIANVYRNNENAWAATAAEWVQLYAK